MTHSEKILDSRVVYRGRVFTATKDTVKLENGDVATREVAWHNGGVGILAIDNQNNILLVRQFRYAHGKVLLEIPAGRLEINEDPAECAIRELEEETGYHAQNVELLAKVYPTPGYVSEVLHIYTAHNLIPTSQNLDPGEFLTFIKLPFDKALEMCLSGDIKDGKTLVAILKYSLLKRINS